MLLPFTGCDTNRVKPTVSFETSGTPIFKPIAVDVWGFESTAPNFMVRDYFPQIESKITDSGLFLDSEKPEFYFDIRWKYENEDPNAAAVSGILRAFTLFIVPDNITIIHTMEIDIYNRFGLVKQYRYKERVEYLSSAFTDNEFVGAKWFHDGVNRILERFILDLKNDTDLLREKPNKEQDRYAA